MEQTETPLSELISSSEQEGSNSKEVAVVKKKSKVFPIVVSILLLLILGVGGYYVYNQYFVDREDNIIKNNNEEEIVEDEDIVETKNDCEEYIMKNSGWALFSLPEYEFSAEISPYRMNKTIEGELIEWGWTPKILENDDSLYPNYLTDVHLEFYPEETYNAFNCGSGCAQEHMIYIEIYENQGAKSLNDVKTIYFENVKNDGAKNNYIPTITEQEEEKWGHNVITFIESAPADFDNYDGHIIVNSKFVYIVRYFRSLTPTESYQESQKVIDSFEFGE